MSALGVDLGVNEIRLAVCEMPGQSDYIGEILLQTSKGSNRTPIRALLDESGASYFSFTPSIDSEHMIFKILADARSRVLQRTKLKEPNCAITIPCGYGARGRQRLQDAAKSAGFENSRLILEPAAVLFAEKKDDVDKLVLICSWGESGCNVLLARQKPGNLIEEVASRGDVTISGRKLIEQLTKQLFRIFREQTGQEPGMSAEIGARLQSKAEEIFIGFSVHQEIDFALSMSTGPGLRKFKLTREDLLNWISADLDRCRGICQQVLQKGGIESPLLIDEVWLAGGVANIPYVRTMLRDWYGRDIHFASKESAARGAAIYAGFVWNNQSKGNEAQSVAVEQPPIPSQETALVDESPSVLTALENFASQETAQQDETRLIQSLHKVDDLLGSGDIQGAVRSIQEAMEVINLYRAKVLHAEGLEIIKKAKNLQNPNSSTPKSVTKEVDAILSQAFQKVQDARKLDHQDAGYRSTLLEIEKLQRARRVEELYERVVDAQKKKRPHDIRPLFKEILDLDPHNEYIKAQYRELLLIDLEKKNTELQQKLKRNKNVKYEVFSIREILVKLKDLDSLDPQLATYLNQIENMLKRY